MSYAASGNPILKLYRHPQHRTALENSNYKKTEVNRSCGDQITLYLRLESDRGDRSDRSIEAASFEGEGCSLCLSSAELACRLLPGVSLTDAQNLGRLFHDYVCSAPNAPEPQGMPEEFRWYQDLRTYPMRQKCALMVWEILAKVSVEELDGDGV